MLIQGFDEFEAKVRSRLDSEFNSVGESLNNQNRRVIEDCSSKSFVNEIVSEVLRSVRTGELKQIETIQMSERTANELSDIMNVLERYKVPQIDNIVGVQSAELFFVDYREGYFSNWDNTIRTRADLNYSAIFVVSPHIEHPTLSEILTRDEVKLEEADEYAILIQTAKILKALFDNKQLQSAVTPECLRYDITRKKLYLTRSYKDIFDKWPLHLRRPKDFYTCKESVRGSYDAEWAFRQDLNILCWIGALLLSGNYEELRRERGPFSYTPISEEYLESSSQPSKLSEFLSICLSEEQSLVFRTYDEVIGVLESLKEEGLSENKRSCPSKVMARLKRKCLSRYLFIQFPQSVLMSIYRAYGLEVKSSPIQVICQALTLVLLMLVFVNMFFG